jgi:hypothetical protein
MARFDVTTKEWVVSRSKIVHSIQISMTSCDLTLNILVTGWTRTSLTVNWEADNESKLWLPLMTNYDRMMSSL